MGATALLGSLVLPQPAAAGGELAITTAALFGDSNTSGSDVGHSLGLRAGWALPMGLTPELELQYFDPDGFTVEHVEGTEQQDKGGRIVAGLRWSTGAPMRFGIFARAGYLAIEHISPSRGLESRPRPQPQTIDGASWDAGLALDFVLPGFFVGGQLG